MSNLIIANVEITTDSNGRYNLNALHKASGLDLNKAPSQWLRNANTQELIQKITDMQICTSPISAVKGGSHQGTFAHELLVVSYAGWISPAFQLKVNQAFIDSRKPKEIQLPNFNNPAESARAWADQFEKNQKLEIELDNAIKTKAEIGSRREATAMATASTAVRKANQLQKKLDQSQEYATVKRMEMIHHGIKFNWRILKRASEELNYPPIDVFDQNYGTVKGWHRDAWKKAYAITIEEIN